MRVGCQIGRIGLYQQLFVGNQGGGLLQSAGVLEADRP
ncbi:Uncharacterised protein [Mycobacteroides abscessus subsp. abscessus]|nr:Uncharacterised protein [Mycobacteroides abscessus subsp. abscessus]